MEERTPVRSNDKPRHRALTPLQVLRGMICLLVLFLTAFMMLVYYGFATSVPLRFFSIHYSRKGTSFFFGAWLALWPFLFEKINNTRVVISGDSLPAKERVLLIANHTTEVDWMYLWDLALRKGRLGYVKYILKSSLMKLPVFGWAFHILEFIPVERKWNVDQSIMQKMLLTFQNPEEPLWLALFPEGTDFTEHKCIRSQKYAAEKGLPLLKNVLLPKTKGFYACLEDLRDTLDAVYDITIGYKNRCPSFLDNAFGVNPSEVHLHVHRINLCDIPMSEDAVSDWLMDRFCVKDKLLSDFHARGQFAHLETERELPMVKCLVNCLFVIVLTVTGSYLTLFGSIWFRVYVSLACAYLASATYFNIRPMPFFGISKSCEL